MSDYSIPQKIIHWLMAFLICLDLFIAQKLGGLMEEWDRLESRSDHATVGTIVAVLFVLRIWFRGRHGAADLPSGMADWQIYAAKIGHWALYFFMGLLIASGLVTAMNAASPIALFGQVDVTIGRTDEDFFQTVRVVHEFATKAMIALIVVHVLAALYHQFVAKDDSTVKMLRFWSSSRKNASSE